MNRLEAKIQRQTDKNSVKVASKRRNRKEKKLGIMR